MMFGVHAGNAFAATAAYEHKLDEAAKFLEEYGAVTISAPILSRPDARFEFGLERTAKEYYDDALKLQGAAATSDQLLQSLGIGGSLQLDPTQAAAYTDALSAYQNRQAATTQLNQDKNAAAQATMFRALELAKLEADPAKRAAAEDKAMKDYLDARQANLAGSTTRPTLSSTDNVPALADPGVDALATAARTALGGQTPTPNRGLLPTEALTILPRSALISASGDRAIQGLLNLFGAPGEAQKMVGREVFFGGSVVSVIPGWRSRTGYAAQLTVHVETIYEDAPADEWTRLATNSELPLEVRVILASKLPSEKQAKFFGTLNDEQRIMLGLTEFPAPEPLPDAASDSDKAQRKKDEMLRLRNRADVAQMTAARVDAQWNHLLNVQVHTDEGGSVREIDWVRNNVHGKKGTFDEAVESFKSEPRRNAAISAISPLTEAQNLDTASSWRRRNEFSLALAAAFRSAGQQAQAKLLETFVREREADVATRAPDIAVASFSAGGGMWGYQIGPSLRGLENPSNPKSKAAYVLQRQSFPVLMMFAFDRSDIQPMIILENGRKKNVTVLSPKLRFTSTPRWMPLKHGWFTSRASETRRLDTASALAESENTFSSASPVTAREAVGLIRTRELIHLMNGAVVKIALPQASVSNRPAFKMPGGVSVTPASVVLQVDDKGVIKNPKVIFAFSGTDFSEETAATLKVDSLSAVVLGKAKHVGGALVVEASIKDAKGPLIFTAGAKDAPKEARFHLGTVAVALETSSRLVFSEKGPNAATEITRELRVDGTPPASFLDAVETMIHGKPKSSGSKPDSNPSNGSAAIKLEVNATESTPPPHP